MNAGRITILLEETTAPVLLDGDGNGDDDLDHFYCCDPDRSLCGADISSANENEFDEDDEDMCVVCYDLQFAICAKCGAV